MSLIDDVAITKPCAALWTEMKGDDRARFCQLCKKNVYDTTALDECEMERMLAAPVAPCLRIHRDTSGRVLTRDRIAALAFTIASAGLAACAVPYDSADSGDSAATTRQTISHQVDGAHITVRDRQGNRVVPNTVIPEVAAPAQTTGQGQATAFPTLGEPAAVSRDPNTPIGRIAPPHSRVEMGDVAAPEEILPVMGGAVAPTVMMGAPPVMERPLMGKPASPKP